MWFKTGKGGRNVYLLIDRSGSMAREWKTTLESVNGYVEKLEDDVNVFIAAFDSTGFPSYNLNGYHVWNGSGGTSNGENCDFCTLRMTVAKDFNKITEEEISPRGGTPLFDAAGKIIDQMLADNPERAVLVVMTDGEENTSRAITHAHLMSKLATLEAKKWPVVYLGAGFKEVSTYATTQFNINEGHTFNTTAATRGAAMKNLAAKTDAYFASATMDFCAYTPEEKAKFEETEIELIKKTEDKPDSNKV